MSDGARDRIGESDPRNPRIGVRGKAAQYRLVARHDTDRSSRADGSDPFVLLNTPGAPYRTYLALLYLGETPSRHRVALMMEPNQYDASRAASPAEAMTNEQVERSWASGFAAMQAVQGSGIAALEPQGVPENLKTGEAPRHSPIAYCRKTEQYVEPVCPSTLGRLETCRDEALLRRSGLPSYKDTLTRFLYSPEAAADPGRPLTFYTYTLQKTENVGEKVTIRRRGELYRDLSPRINTGVETPPETHPCFTCEHRTTCYPPGKTLEEVIPAEEQLFPLAYYDFFYLPRQPLLLSMTESAVLLGGGGLGRILEGRTLRKESPNDRQADWMKEILSPPKQQFFFEGDRSGLFALECLYLKLAGMAQVFHGVQSLQKTAGRPHLGLSPDRIRAGLRAEASHLPARWSIDLEITDAVSTAPMASIEVDKVPGEPVVWSIPEPKVAAFLPSSMLKGQIQTQTMRLDTKTLEVRPEMGEHYAYLTASLVAPHYNPTDHGSHDLVRVVAQIAGSVGRIVFAGRKIDGGNGQFLFSGSAGPMTKGQATAVESSRLNGATVEVTIIRSYGAPSDLVALGRLFLCYLLWNDRGDAERITPEKIDQVGRALAQKAGSLVSWEDLNAALKQAGLSLDPESVLYRAEDREVETAIPDALWSEALVTAFRMATLIPGWSFCGAIDDYPFDDPGAPLHQVVLEMDGLAERARGALIGSSGRNNVVLDVCNDFLDDLGEATAGGPSTSGPDSAEMTMIVGRPPTQ